METEKDARELRAGRRNGLRRGTLLLVFWFFSTSKQRRKILVFKEVVISTFSFFLKCTRTRTRTRCSLVQPVLEKQNHFVLQKAVQRTPATPTRCNASDDQLTSNCKHCKQPPAGHNSQSCSQTKITQQILTKYPPRSAKTSIWLRTNDYAIIILLKNTAHSHLGTSTSSLLSCSAQLMMMLFSVTLKDSCSLVKGRDCRCHTLRADWPLAATKRRKWKRHNPDLTATIRPARPESAASFSSIPGDLACQEAEGDESFDVETA